MKYRLSVALCMAVLSLAGCKTQFFGEAKVPGGAQGCQAVCQNLGMSLAGMVVMGEYSDGCICEVTRRAPSTEAPGRAESSESSQQSRLVYVGANGAMAAAAGVADQTDDDDDANSSQPYQ